jgi:23S rRNA (adenine2503-C2)-methyltransferase
MTATLHLARDAAAPALSNKPIKPSLVGLDREGLKAALLGVGVPEKQTRMRASQIYQWLYAKGVTSFDAMTNMTVAMRAEMDAAFSIERPEIVTEQISSDGTRKWLIKLPPQAPDFRPHEVETVFIPDNDRGTLCVSSQVGCTLTCSFCHTGTQKLVRNLTSGEIVAQIMLARDCLDDWPKTKIEADHNRQITNIVMMGMGEPLYNFDEVKRALLIVSDGEGLSISKRRITLSTSGVVPEIKRCGDEIGVMLAISLHGVRDEVRNELVPLNKKYPLEVLLEACRTYPGASNARRVTFEYVMLKGVNDSLADARELVRLLKGIPAKINLIPFNPWPGTAYECSDWEQIEKFAEVVNRAGYASPVRTPRGRDIMAACGQLKSETQKIRASDLKKMASMEATAGRAAGL